MLYTCACYHLMFTVHVILLASLLCILFVYCHYFMFIYGYPKPFFCWGCVTDVGLLIAPFIFHTGLFMFVTLNHIVTCDILVLYCVPGLHTCALMVQWCFLKFAVVFIAVFAIVHLDLFLYTLFQLVLLVHSLPASLVYYICYFLNVAVLFYSLGGILFAHHLHCAVPLLHSFDCCNWVFGCSLLSSFLDRFRICLCNLIDTRPYDIRGDACEFSLGTSSL